LASRRRNCRRLEFARAFVAPAEAETETVVHFFNGSPDDGYSPYAELIHVKGALYGTTELGGSYGYGTVFSITPRGIEKVLYSFYGGNDGAEPWAGLVDVNGVLYGTTELGGSSTNCAYGCGTVFSIAPDGTEKVVYSFCSQPDCTDGAAPFAGLISVGGTLYGTTYAGGDINCNRGAGCGTVFSIAPNGTETVLHAFHDSIDGAFPRAKLLNVNGTLYGTTVSGGVHAYYGGTVFSITPQMNHIGSSWRIFEQHKTGENGGRTTVSHGSLAAEQRRTRDTAATAFLTSARR
jgi:uncharacterized repeat protein (TIGR03803 family)